MMTLQRDVDITQLNTLRVSSRVSRYVAIRTREVIVKLYQQGIIGDPDHHDTPIYLMGEGSNTIPKTDYLTGTLLQMKLKGIRLLKRERHGVVWRVAAGESWHPLVMTTLLAGYSGLENLALIPGTVGAAPVQNIGAYGVELSDHLQGVEVFDLRDGSIRWLSRAACQCGYRESLFKQQAGKALIILSVDLRLSSHFTPRLTYKPLAEWAKQQSIGTLTPLTIAQQVMQIRQQKLPDPKQLPNVGSFFKNPIVNQSTYQALKKEWPDLVAYPLSEDNRHHYKLAAGWLIEQAGMKGYRQGYLGMHQHQALVMVNHAEPARGERLMPSAVEHFAQQVSAQVERLYSVTLEREPRFIE